MSFSLFSPKILSFCRVVVLSYYLQAFVKTPLSSSVCWWLEQLHHLFLQLLPALVQLHPVLVQVFPVLVQLLAVFPVQHLTPVLVCLLALVLLQSLVLAQFQVMAQVLVCLLPPHQLLLQLWQSPLFVNIRFKSKDHHLLFPKPITNHLQWFFLVYVLRYGNIMLQLNLVDK